MSTFQELGLNEALLKGIADLGFETPSEVQEKAIPILLNEETDLVALAQTGTGKTAAFGFPMLQKIDVASRTTQGLILSPTRELCLQIANEMKAYGKHLKGLNVVAIYGGSSITDQAREVKRGAQIIVATPGRMKDMIKRRLVDITKIQYSVLDEADEMLNMGFKEDITDILSGTPDDKNTWLFSATMPKEVSTIARKFMNDPQEITVGHKNQSTNTVSHEYYMVNARDRYQALKRLADANPNIFSVIFCRTKRDTQKVAENLIEDGYSAGALHGDLSQNQRDIVMKQFRNRQIQMLVATDVAARGIDVDDITHVINYQLSDEIETYTHRSGRTGRAGKTGISMVIVSRSELRRLKSIERIINKKFELKEVPNGMAICEVQLMSSAKKIHETQVSEEIDKYLEDINALFEETSKEELIKKFFSAEFSRFYNYYQKSKNLNVTGGDSGRDGGRDGGRDSGRQSSGSAARYFINVGEKDGFDWMKLKDFLKEVLDLGRDDVFKVDCKDTFSFFNTEKEHQEKVLAFFTDYKHEGRFVNVEITEDKPSRGGRGRGGSGGGGGRRREGGFGGDRRRSGGGDRRSSGSGERRGRRSEGSGDRSDRRRGSDDSPTRSKRSDGGDRDKGEFKTTHSRSGRSRRKD